MANKNQIKAELESAKNELKKWQRCLSACPPRGWHMPGTWENEIEEGWRERYSAEIESTKIKISVLERMLNA